MGVKRLQRFSFGRRGGANPLWSLALRTLYCCLALCVASYILYLKQEPLLEADAVESTTGARCEDETIACGSWAIHDLCVTNSGFMHEHCPLSCGLCGQSPAAKEERRTKEEETGTTKAMVVGKTRHRFYVFDEKRVGAECADRNLRKCYHAEGWVVDLLLELGWKRVYKMKEADFIWTFAREFGFSLASLGKHQVVNHVDGAVARKLGDKSKLYHTLEQYKVGCDTNKYIPPTFDTTKEAECTRLLKLLRRNNSFGEDARWLLKPAYGSGGQGIQILASNKDMMNHLIGLDAALDTTNVEEVKTTCRKDQVDAGVAQKYIPNPLLLKFLNYRKFNVRAYVLIASTDPLQVHVSEDYSYISASAIPYNNSEDDHFMSRAMALTGLHAQEHLGKNYDPSKRMYSLHEVATAVEEEFPDRFGGEKESFLKHVSKAIEVLARLTILSATEEEGTTLFRSPRHFNIMAFDMLLDQAFHLWLLEVNCYPWMSFEEENQNPHKSWMKQMVEETVVQSLEASKLIQREAMDLPKRCWKLILDTATPSEGETAGPLCPNA